MIDANFSLNDVVLSMRFSLGHLTKSPNDFTASYPVARRMELAIEERRP